MKKKIATLTLVTMLSLQSIGMFTYGAGTETDVAASTSDLKEQYKYKADEKQIVDTALDQTDGKKAAEQINNLEGEAFYEGVSDILEEYYDKEGNADKKLAAFESGINKEADSILKDYAEAAEERSRASELDYMPYSIIVEFDSSTDDDTIYKIINTVSDGGQIITGMYGIDAELPEDKKEQIKDAYEEMNTKIVSVKVGKNQTTEECIREYDAMDIVKSVSRNDIQEASGSGLTNDTDSPKQWYLDKINVSDAWNAISKANKCAEVKVAVIDTGVDLNHNDIRGNYDDANCVDVTGDKPVKLSDVDKPYINNHGTMVASIIAAKTNNNRGIAGVCGVSNTDNGYKCKIMGIKAAIIRNQGETEGVFILENELKAMDYAISHGADIINMSLNGYTYHQAFQNIINIARNRGIMVVGAAGNDNTDTPSYPSDYAHVTSVIGVYSNNNKVDGSNYGNNKDISAPGFKIWACDTKNGYGADIKGGTSYAAPMVAAAAAMIKSVNTNLTPAEIETIIKSTATDIGQKGYDEYTAHGLLNAGLAVQRAIYRSYYDVKPVIQEVSSPSSGKVKIKWSSVYNEEDMLIYRSTSKDGTYSRVGKVEISKPGVKSFTDSGLESGTVYYYKIRCRSAYGDSFNYGIYSNKVSAKAS